ARSQRLVASATRHDLNAHRYALHDLGEVTRGIVGWQERELRASRRADAQHLALDATRLICVDLDGHGLTRTHGRKLRLLEVRGDPGTGVRDDPHQRLARLNELADLDLLARHDP